MGTPTDNIGCRCLICVHYPREQLDVFDASHVDAVLEHQWAVVVIPDGATGMWAFTIGLWHNYRSPELAIFGLDPQTMGRCLNGLGRQIATGRPAEINDGVRPVDPDWRAGFFGAAGAFYQQSAPSIPFLQMLWPDGDGRFPGQSGCDSECADGQPWLWLSRRDHPAGSWIDELA